MAGRAVALNMVKATMIQTETGLLILEVNLSLVTPRIVQTGSFEGCRGNRTPIFQRKQWMRL